MNRTECDICQEDVKTRGGYCSIKGRSIKHELDGKGIAGEDCLYLIDVCQTCFDQIDKEDIINILSDKFYMDDDKQVPQKLQRTKTKTTKKA